MHISFSCSAVIQYIMRNLLRTTVFHVPRKCRNQFLKTPHNIFPQLPATNEFSWFLLIYCLVDQRRNRVEFIRFLLWTNWSQTPRQWRDEPQVSWEAQPRGIIFNYNRLYLAELKREMELRGGSRFDKSYLIGVPLLMILRGNMRIQYTMHDPALPRDNK